MRDDVRVNPVLANPAGNQLCVLSTEIDDENRASLGHEPIVVSRLGYRLRDPSGRPVRLVVHVPPWEGDPNCVPTRSTSFLAPRRSVRGSNSLIPGVCDTSSESHHSRRDDRRHQWPGRDCERLLGSRAQSDRMHQFESTPWLRSSTDESRRPWRMAATRLVRSHDGRDCTDLLARVPSSTQSRHIRWTSERTRERTQERTRNRSSTLISEPGQARTILILTTWLSRVGQVEPQSALHQQKFELPRRKLPYSRRPSARVDALVLEGRRPSSARAVAERRDR